MTKKITSGQEKQIKNFMGEIGSAPFFLLTDDRAVEWLIKWAHKTRDQARQLVATWRREARKRDIADDVRLHAEVLAGCTVKQGLPLMGPCYKQFQYLKDWDFPDEPTGHALVSWIPSSLADFTSMDVGVQKQLVAAFKTAAKFPVWYQVSFGSLVHVGGLALAHFKATGKDPFVDLVARTDTCDADGIWLQLLWDGRCLGCTNWFDDGADRDIGVVAVGVVPALGH